MTYQQLQYFLSVAELLSFTKAANRHFMAQPAISQQISSLERELGVKLFRRSTHSVQLTEAGRSFYQTAGQTLRTLDNGISIAKNIQLHNLKKTLTIGFVGAPENSLLAEAIRIFWGRCQDTNIDLLRRQAPFELKTALVDKDCDACFLFTNDIDSSGKIAYEPLMTFPMCVYLSAEHELAARKSIRQIELEGNTLIRPATDHNGIKAGEITPNIPSNAIYKGVLVADSLESVLIMIEAGIGVGIFPQYVSHFCTDNIRWIPVIEDEDYPLIDSAPETPERDTEFSLAWLRTNKNKSLPVFLEILKEILARREIISG